MLISNFLFIAIFLFLINFLVFFLLWKCTKNLLSPPLIYFYIWVSFEIGNFRFFLEKGNFTLIAISVLSAIFYGLGVFFYNFIHKIFSIKKIKNYNFFNPFPSDNLYNFLLISTVLFSFVVIAVNFFVSGIPLFSQDVVLAKIQASQGAFNVLLSSLAIVGSYILLTLLLYNFSKKRGQKNFIFLYSLIVILPALLSGWKGGVIGSLLWLGVLISYLKNISFKQIFILSFLGLLSFSFVTSFYRGSDSVLKKMWDRMTISSSYGLNVILEEIVPQKGFLRGETFFWEVKRVLTHLGIGEKQPVLTEILIGVQAGEGYGADSSLPGTLYLNWAMTGVIIGMFIYGYFLEYLYIKSLRMTKNILFFPFFVLFQSIIVSIGWSGTSILLLERFVISYGIVFIVISLIYVILSLPTGSVVIKRKI